MSPVVSEPPVRVAARSAQAAQARGAFPLSQMQSAYLIGRGDLLPLGGVSSHVYHEFELEHVRTEPLQQALRQVVARHPALRTVIGSDEHQRVLDLSAMPTPLIAVHDARALPHAAAVTLHMGLREVMSAQVAALDRPCAVDAQLMLLPGGRGLLLVSHDGLQVDGISMQILFTEWARAYADPAVPLPALAASYRAQVDAERRLRDSLAWRNAREHWLTRLQREQPSPPRLPLAADPASLSRGVTDRHDVRVDAERFTRFERNAAACGLTNAAALFAAYAEVLARWSGPGAITLNVTLANRLPLTDDTDDAIGNYTVPVLVRHGHTQATFAQRALAAQASMRESMEHRHFSALDVMRHLAGGNDPSLAAGVPYTFNCALGHATSQGELMGVETLGRQTFGASQTPQVWMNAFALRSRGGLWLQIDAVQGLFAPGVPEAVAAAFEALLQALADRESAWHESGFDLLPAAQRRRRDAANNTAKPAPSGLIHEGFVAHAEARPQAVALFTSAGDVSYGALLRDARALAAALAQHMVQPDEPVAVALVKGPQQIAAVLGVAMAGAAYLPIDPAWPRARREAVLLSAQPRVLLCESAFDDSGPSGHRRVHVDCVESALGQPESPLATRADHLAYVLYTSGSTGQPKGVMVSHASVVNLVADINERYAVGPEDRAFGISHFNFDLSVYDIFGMLAAGGAIVLPDHDKVADPAHWLELAQRHGVTLWNSVPSIVQMLADHCEAAAQPLPDSLRLVLMSGDRIPPALPLQLRRQDTKAALHSLGGPTETTVWNVCCPIGELPPGASHVPYGRPNANNRYHVLDEQMHDCPDWVVGELYAAGTGLARGYWKDEARTQAAFITHPRTSERLYRTGDIGRYLPDGNLEIHGRSDFQVKVNGHRIELGEIEACLAGHDQVHACAVVGPRPHDTDGVLVAFVVPNNGCESLAPALIESLKQHVAQRLPHYMVPSRFIGLARLPLSDNAKVDRKQLAALQAVIGEPRSLLEPPAQPVMSALEQRLSQLWCELLKQPAISPTQNFFTLGGDSMKAARLIVRLRKDFALAASLAQVMNHPTVRELAGFLSTQTPATARAVAHPPHAPAVRPLPPV